MIIFIYVKRKQDIRDNADHPLSQTQPTKIPLKQAKIKKCALTQSLFVMDQIMSSNTSLFSDTSFKCCLQG